MSDTNRPSFEPTRSEVLARLLSGAEMDVLQLVGLTGLSQSTVFRSVEELLTVPSLLERRLVRQVGRGRPTTRVAFNRRYAVSVGVVLGSTTTRVVLTDALGATIAQVRAHTPQNSSAIELADWLVREVTSLAERSGGGAPLGAVAVALPGAVTRERDRVVGSFNLPQITGAGLIDRVRELIQVPVVFENDSHLALLGELDYGRMAKTGTTVLVTMGTGISAAVAVDGEILVGDHGSLGEFGRLTLPGSELRIKDLLSGAGFVDYARAAGIPIASSREFAEISDRYPELVRQIDQTLEHLLSIVALAYEPHTVLLTGSFSQLFDSDRLREIASSVAAVSLVECRVQRADLGDDSTILGTIALALRALYAEFGIDGQLDALPQADEVPGRLSGAPTVGTSDQHEPA
jgi:predicted NBD/HSP70 family sugar kinase